jgi:hypothetical protein
VHSGWTTAGGEGLSSSYHGRVLQRFVLLLEITEIGHWELKRETVLLPPWTGSSKACPPSRDNRDRSLGTGRGSLSSSHHGRVLQRFVLLLELTEIGHWELEEGNCPPPTMDGFFFKCLSSY